MSKHMQVPDISELDLPIQFFDRTEWFGNGDWWHLTIKTQLIGRSFAQER
jgi:hypothetical protein